MKRSFLRELPPLLTLLCLAGCGGGETSSESGGSAGASPSGGAAGSGAGGSAGHGGSSGGSAGSSATGGHDPGLPPGNALLMADGSVTVLYPVSAAGAGTRAVGFLRSGSVVTAVDEHGEALWEKDLGPGEMFGGFDFDSDGFPDLGFVRTADTGTPCGAQTIQKTSIEVARGNGEGSVIALVPPEDAICWNFAGTIYPTNQWTGLDVLFGANTGMLATSAYYAQSGAFWKWNGAGFDQAGTFQFPSTAAYDAAYTNDKPNAYGQGQSFVLNSHVANGLFTSAGGEERLVFFTSSRAVEYAPGPLGADQLRADVPYLSAGRTDIAGRNYGLVAADPGMPDHLVLVSGTSADTMYADMVSASMTADPWGQIERHVSIVHLAAGTVEDRFFSYAHDNGDGNKYQGRVVYPDNPFVRRGEGQPSRLAFNVYEGGHWQLHVTQPGSTADALVVKDMFLWDIRDLGGEGIENWVLSPVRDPGEPDVPGYYYVKWRTVLGYWDETNVMLKDNGPPLEGAIPLLMPAFRRPEKSTSRSHLYPALVARVGPTLEFLLRGADGKLMSSTVSPVF